MDKNYLKKRINSFGYAFNGLRIVFKTQANAQIHLVAVAIVSILGYLLKINSMEWISLLICMGMVISAETMNTAVEFLTDFVSPDFHSQAGKVKDLAAGAVLICAIISVITGIIIFIPKIILLFS